MANKCPKCGALLHGKLRVNRIKCPWCKYDAHSGYESLYPITSEIIHDDVKEDDYNYIYGSYYDDAQEEVVFSETLFSNLIAFLSMLQTESLSLQNAASLKRWMEILCKKMN